MHRSSHLYLKHFGWFMIVLAGIMLMSLIAACTPKGINVAQAANLAQTTQIDIIEPQTIATPLLVITDAAAIQKLVGLLDVSLSPGPLARCLGQYRLSFHLRSGEIQRFEYFCQGGSSFLRGDQAFWSGQQVQPPAAFDDLLQALLRAE